MNEIIPAEEVIKFDPTKDIKQGQQAAKALMKLIELTKPLKLGGKDYLFFEHWITIARFFNATVGIEWTKQTETGWEAKAIVHQNGQIIGSAEASCNNDEVNWKTKPDFQRKSMAQTRACSKALRQIFGYIPVLVGISATPAEEMDNMPLLASKPLESPNISATEPTMRASDKQIALIKTLIKQKGQSGKVSDEQINLLSLPDAKKWIDRLLKMSDKTEDDVIQLDEPYIPNHEGD